MEACHSARQVVDPAERWESPVSSAAALRVDPAGKAARLSLPSCESALPPGMLRAMRYACGSLPLERVLLLTPGVRPIDRLCRRFVAVPPQLLGFGERAMGLWVEWRAGDPAVTVSLDRVGAVEDVHVLQYRRLAVRTATARLAIRYDEETGQLLEPLLRWFRRRLAGETPAATPAATSVAAVPADLPPDWRAVAEAVLAEAAPGRVAILHGSAPADPGGLPALRVLIALTPTELLVLAGPLGPAQDGPAAPDRLVIPRRALQTIETRQDRLMIRAAGVERVLRVGAALAGEARDLLERGGPQAMPASLAR
ncbi:MAG: hypothetical protein ACP5VP_05440 [Candidatus Limnocylindrales bacterium]